MVNYLIDIEVLLFTNHKPDKNLRMTQKNSLIS